jgi:hypothetical protein
MQEIKNKFIQNVLISMPLYYYSNPTSYNITITIEIEFSSNPIYKIVMCPLNMRKAYAFLIEFLPTPLMQLKKEIEKHMLF